MDRPIEKRRSNRKRQLGIALVVIVSAAYAISSTTGRSALSTPSERIRIAEIERATFEEYIPITGSVQPMTTVYLDLKQGGIVENVLIESGTRVEQGDVILELSNVTLQKQNIDSETRLLENLDRLRNSKRNLTEKRLLLQQDLLDLDHQIEELVRTLQRYEVLIDSATPAISREEYESAMDDLIYLRNKRDLLEMRIAQEAALRDAQITQIDESIVLVNRSLGVLQEIAASLEVRAPISGFLSSMEAEVGQSFANGDRIGRIDQLDSFKVLAGVDQFYISRVQVGQSGKSDFAGQTHELRISKIHPEVTDEYFQVELEFVDGTVNGIKRGQTLMIDLLLSDARVTTIAKKGGFYRETNGRWVYLVDERGETAERVPIVPGRHNPNYFEILEGLDVGDWIITSSYSQYHGADILEFSEPLQLCTTCK